ncbi:urea ABC transporter permease subunit UrtB [Taklimakanibacter lacteus]|uniref:urea ABC transporter permease subunit UrtB n=1 Tax=Taklimakanibacter lacteus TaxID=2268456 RepID=UPI000E666B9B
MLLAVALATMLTIALMVTHAMAADLATEIKSLDTSNFAQKEKAIAAIAATGDARVAAVLTALNDNKLLIRKADRLVVIAEGKGNVKIENAATGEALGEAAEADLDRIAINNKIRRQIKVILGGLTLFSDDPAVRLKAADDLFRSRDLSSLQPLKDALAKEQDPQVRQAMMEALAALTLVSDAPEAEKLAAVLTVKARGDQDAIALLSSVAQGSDAVARAATEALTSLEWARSFWDSLQNAVYGLSLGSVLLLAAIGLAITFGVMGVINMAHGEMVMIGAYVTFLVQEVIRGAAPDLLDQSLFIAVPLAFLVTALIGIAIERSIIRFLYGRPLETLLATWGLSLILQQAIRSLFGPTNREVSTPSWMSGSLELGALTLTANRLAIIVFALLVFVGLLLLLRHSRFGLEMRAVTQNRQMASAMGIHTARVDALTFGLGSGIAGIAGVALSQIDNVSPNLGQSYIIDSFMVVVFGGVGNLWGTLVAALTLGIANKFLEPFAGAVLGKILVLVFIILFIQKRPRGLFALKGRAVEA